jgi:hypothetical protein
VILRLNINGASLQQARVLRISESTLQQHQKDSRNQNIGAHLIHYLVTPHISKRLGYRWRRNPSHLLGIEFYSPPQIIRSSQPRRYRQF